MRSYALTVQALYVFFLSSSAHEPSQKVASRDLACEKLIAVAEALELADGAKGEYSCGSVEEFEDRDFFLIDLKFRPYENSARWIGSSLVGWYGVNKIDGAVHEVDLGEGAIGSRLQEREK